jgi:hypothetical protein
MVGVRELEERDVGLLGAGLLLRRRLCLACHPTRVTGADRADG